MSPEDRERLIEEMAKRSFREIFGDGRRWDSDDTTDDLRQVHRISSSAGLAAIEAAGFAIVPPDDGR